MLRESGICRVGGLAIVVYWVTERVLFRLHRLHRLRPEMCIASLWLRRGEQLEFHLGV